MMGLQRWPESTKRTGLYAETANPLQIKERFKNCCYHHQENAAAKPCSCHFSCIIITGIPLLKNLNSPYQGQNPADPYISSVPGSKYSRTSSLACSIPANPSWALAAALISSAENKAAYFPFDQFLNVNLLSLISHNLKVEHAFFRDRRLPLLSGYFSDTNFLCTLNS
jgi:hypothetical protein